MSVTVAVPIDVLEISTITPPAFVTKGSFSPLTNVLTWKRNTAILFGDGPVISIWFTPVGIIFSSDTLKANLKNLPIKIILSLAPAV